MTDHSSTPADAAPTVSTEESVEVDSAKQNLVETMKYFSERAQRSLMRFADPSRSLRSPVSVSLPAPSVRRRVAWWVG